jgi:hypothetical protein
LSELGRNAILRLLFLSDYSVHRRRDVADQPFFNNSTSETHQHPRPPIVETVPAETIAPLHLEVTKEASPAKDDVSPVRHHKPKMLAHQRNNYGYGNSLGYAEETQYGPKRLFSNW